MTIRFQRIFGHIFSKRLLIVFLLVFVPFLNLFAQTDTEFWFSIPEINRYHQSGNVANPCNDGTPTRFRITTLDEPAIVTISMPANEANFTPITLNIPANFTETLNLFNYISDQVIVDNNESMENVLAWTSSNTTASEQYINRGNKGIKIESTSLITVYYEIGAINNKELLTLKGKNALGEKFFIPFQTNFDITSGYDFTRRPYGSFDIVATHNETQVRIIVPRRIFVFDDAGGATFLNAGVHNLWLDAGQTSIIAPYANRTGEYKTSRTDELAGAMVEVVQNEPGVTKTVAVITKEDMVNSPGSVDFVADQLVPTTHIGTSYAVVRGYAQNNGTLATYEYFYIVGTEPSTTVDVVFSDGAAVIGTATYTVNAGIQQDVQMPFAAQVATVQSSKPVYVFHRSGVGTQFAGSIIPTISVCTGNFTSAFNRTMKANSQSCPLNPATTSSGDFDFYLNILVYNGAEDGFTLLKEGVDVTAAELPELLPANAATTFMPLPGAVAPFTNYSFARIKADAIVENTAYRLVNSKNVFHLGIINGAGTGVSAQNADAFYGYFSDFNEITPTVFEGYAQDDSYVGCYGDDVPLNATGGSQYLWTPNTFLDDPTISSPTAINVTSSIEYTVTISGACDLTASLPINVTVSDEVIANFDADVLVGCAPLKVEFTNQSTGYVDYEWDLNGDGDYSDAFWWEGTDPADPTLPIDPNNPPNPGGVLGLEKDILQDTDDKFTAWFDNNTDAPIDYEVILKVHDFGRICTKQVVRVIRVYPRIGVDAKANIYQGCQPLEIDFEATPSGYSDGATYNWELGNEDNVGEQNPSYTYFNPTPAGWVLQEFRPKVTITDQWGVCKKADSVFVRVYPYNEADFFISDTIGCSPLEVNVKDNSFGGINSYNWSIVSDPIGHPVDPVPPSSDPFTRSFINETDAPIEHTIRLTVANSYTCSNSIEKKIRVNPEIDVTLNPFPPDKVCDSTEIVFGSSIAHPSLPNVGYSWSFGDGGVSQDAGDTNLYRNFGNTEITYPIILTAVTEHGCADTETAMVEVAPRIVANFSLDKPEICSGEEITFTYHRMPSINSYTFEFDNYSDGYWPGDILANGSFTKQFVNETGMPIEVTVRLTVENDNKSCTKTIEKKIIVNPKVTAQFSTDFGSNTLRCNPLEVSFSNSSIYSGYGSQHAVPFNGTYQWDFGDGTASTLSDPVHTFTNDNPNSVASFEVVLTATSEHGCSHTVTRTIEVQPKLEAEFTMNPGSICSPMDVTFTPSSIGATRFLWDFDDIVDDEERYSNDPFTHTFSSSNPNTTENHIVTLTVVNAAGCTDVYEQPITLYPLVVSGFTANETIGCSDLEVTFTNTSTGGGLEYEWDFGNGQSSTTSNNTVTHTFVNRSAADKTFYVKLIATNQSGCGSDSIIPITVHPKVEADFSYTAQSNCTPFNVVFENGSLNGNSFEWDFGHMGLDSVTTSTNPIEILFDNSTPNDILTYTVSLITTDLTTGCSHDTSRLIEVYPRVVANFDVDVTEGCNPLTVEFTNGSTGLGTYKWDFGDETSSTATSPTKLFSHSDRENTKEFTVQLTSTNPNGCKDIKDTIITVYPLVEANFTINELEGCTPLTVEVENNTVSSAYTYQWDFGDGQTSTSDQPGGVTIENELNPLALFQPTITLETRLNPVDYPEECLQSFSRQVTVFPDIHPNFTGNLEGCHPHTVNFSNATNAFGGTSAATYQWDFGTGTSSAVDLNKAFTNTSHVKDSTYIISLTATSTHGCTKFIDSTVVVHPNPLAVIELGGNGNNTSCSPFEVEFENVSQGIDLEFEYIFGDGADSTTVSANDMVHVFSNLTNQTQLYTTVFTATTEFGCTDQFTQEVYVYPQVIADFSFDPGAELCNPATATMVNNSLNGQNFTWYFDENNSSSSYVVSPTHTFLNNTVNDSVFSVTLIASSNLGCIDTLVLPLTVFPQPVANFSINPPKQTYPNAMFVFDNQTRPISPEWDFVWDFGDNKPNSTEMQPGAYEYETWGPKEDNFRYFVTLSVDNGWCSDQITHPLTLFPAKPEALFEVDNSSSCPPLRVKFINASSYGDSYLWDFDDGTTSTEEEPIHTFYEEGYYNVSLTVDGDGGQSITYNQLQVYPLPEANFSVLPQTVVLPDDTANFYNLSVGATSYLWDFGDGAISTLVNPSHYYTELGTFEVQLIAFTEFFCSDTLTREAAVVVKGAGTLRFPNAFVPSKTGPNGGNYFLQDAYRNEIFHPIHEGVIEYKLMIFNRWGQQIFESDDVNIGWDGYYNGQLSAQDVYVWRAVGKFSNGRSFNMRGNVTLLR